MDHLSGGERSAELSAESAHTRETFAHFGLAMFRVQCVEKQLAMLLATTLNPGFLRATPEARDSYFDGEFRKTLGQLVKSVQAVVSVPQALEGRLNRALMLRNWLAHEYFWQRSIQAMSWDGRERMIAELKEAAEYLGSLDEELTAISEAWCVREGLSRETVEAELEGLLRDSGAL
jgi:hypothetical protein